MTKRREKTSIKPLMVPLWPNTGNTLHLGKSSTYKAADAGQIPTKRFGRRRLVSVAWIERVTAADGD